MSSLTTGKLGLAEDSQGNELNTQMKDLVQGDHRSFARLKIMILNGSRKGGLGQGEIQVGLRKKAG